MTTEKQLEQKLREALGKLADRRIGPECLHWQTALAEERRRECEEEAFKLHTLDSRSAKPEKEEE